MKKIIVALAAVCCLFIAGYGQDSSSRFSVGVLAGPYFNTGADDYIYPIYNTYRGTEKSRNLSYGAEFTWYLNNFTSHTRHGITARFVLSTIKNKSEFKGFSSPFYDVEESTSSIQRNYIGSLGYRLQRRLAGRLYLLFGADIMYIGHEKSFGESNLQMANHNSGIIVNSRIGHTISPMGYSAGLDLNAGLEYEIFTNFTLSGQIIMSAFYNHYFGSSQSKYVYKNTSGESSTISQYQINSHKYIINPFNYTISARYYF